MNISNDGAPVRKAAKPKKPKPAAKKPAVQEPGDHQGAHARLLAHAADVVAVLAHHARGLAEGAQDDEPLKPAAGKKTKVKKDGEDDGGLEYAIVKSLDEKRYTFGPLYTPGELDAHGEYVTAEDLEKAAHAVIPAGATKINKQHDRGAAPIGQIVDWVVWPYEQEVELSVPGREVRKAVLPAGTVYTGVVWDDGEWPSVKGGAITGYSLGGRAVRVRTGEVLPSSRR